jgi:hypothetical protein
MTTATGEEEPFKPSWGDCFNAWVKTLLASTLAPAMVRFGVEQTIGR